MHMYESKVEDIQPDRIQQLGILRDAEELKFSEVIKLWQDDDDFVRFFIALLASCPYESLRWETPPVTTATVDQTFQFVLVNSPALGGRTPDTRSFAAQLSSCNQSNPVATFENLGGDAMMVVPAGLSSDEVYVELASFTRGAPMDQQLELWRSVGAAMDKRVGDRPTWLSTAGGGVAWLHVRLDSRPKYYAYAPYRNAG